MPVSLEDSWPVLMLHAGQWALGKSKRTALLRKAARSVPLDATVTRGRFLQLEKNSTVSRFTPKQTALSYPWINSNRHFRMRSLQYLLILLQSLWMPCHQSQKVYRASGNGAYLPQDRRDRSKTGDQYIGSSVLSKANPGLHPGSSVWQGRNQRIANRNLQRKPLVYPGSHNFRSAPRYPIHNRPSYPRRLSSASSYPQAVRSQVQYRSGYIPAYGAGSQQSASQRVADGNQRYKSHSWVYSYDLNPPRDADQWGPWGSWSACSRSCDGGVRTRTRTCQSRYKPVEISLHRGNVGAARRGNCAGSPHDFQPCSTQLCSSRKSFKDQKYESRVIQCQEFNNKNYLGKKYIWVPYMRASLKECRLYCMAKGHRMFVELAQQVKDGTPCGEDGTEACYHGECTKHRPKIAVPEISRPANSWANRALEAPENQIQYKQRPQVKFVRKVIEGVFNTTSSLKVGYNSIFKVPAGATDIFISEAKASRNYLALKVAGKYVINGGWQIDLSKEVKAAGTVIRYKISPGQYSTESFTAKGPVQDEIDVQLLYQEEKPHIVYNYTIKVPDVKSPVHPGVAHAPSYRAEEQDSNVSYEWRINGITPCSAPCGGGEQEYIYRCSTPRPNGSPEVVADYLCGHSPPPKSKRMCNMPPCPSRWVALPWKPCTKTCGRGGVQLRDIRCRKMTKRNGKDTEINVPISQCNIRTRPELQRECPYRPCYRQWKAEQWSECTKSCDKGMQSRVIHCLTEEGFKLPHDACDASKKPQQTRVCNRQPCTSNWFTSDWSECSTQCGEGIQRRIVYCAGIGGSAVPDLQCHKEGRPHETQNCQVGDCKGIWLTSNWTKCSSVCGPGVQSRVVICAAVFDGKFKEVDSSDCNPEARPDAKQECSPGPCSDTLWFMTSWSKCSVECGTGIQRRSVTCLTSDGHAGRGCQLENKPSEVQRCESYNCDARKTEAASLQRGSLHVDNYRTLERAYEGQTSAHEITAISQPLTKAPSSLKLTTEYDRDTQTEENSSKKRTAGEGNPTDHFISIGPNHVQEMKTMPQKIETTTSAIQPTTTLPTTAQPTEPTTLAKTTTVAKKTKLMESSGANTSCRDQKSLNYCKVILRLQFCKFTLYRRRCCASCGKHGRS